MAGRARRHPVAPNGTLIWCPVNRVLSRHSCTPPNYPDPSIAPAGSTKRSTTAGAWSPERSTARSVPPAETVSTRRFPELVKAVADLDAPSIVLDGEVVMFDRQLLSRFEWLRIRPKHEVMTPPMYMVFDLLELDGKDLRTRPLRERREALEQRVAGHQLIIPVRRLPSNGLEAWDEVLRCNYEGMVAKDPASTYTLGRTLSWLKVKQRNYRQEARGF